MLCDGNNRDSPIFGFIAEASVLYPRKTQRIPGFIPTFLSRQTVGNRVSGVQSVIIAFTTRICVDRKGTVIIMIISRYS